MTNTSRRKIETPFHPLTAELAKEWYSKNYLTTAGYLVAIKNIIRPPGVELRINNVVAFCKEWGISKSAFYRAVETLREEFEWEATHGIILRERSNTDEVIVFPTTKSVPQAGHISHERNTNSRKQDNQSHERNTNSRKQDNQSHERNTQTSKLLPNKDSSAPQTIQTYSDFKKTLSKEERENFEKFVREEYFKDEGKKIRNFTSFMSDDHFQEWLERWNDRPEAVQATTFNKWTNHPQYKEWVAEIESSGNPMMFASGNKEKKEFIKWANENKIFSWQREEGQ